MALSTNWRYTGNKYMCGKSGSDASAGSTSAPYKTLAQIISSLSSTQTGIVRSCIIYLTASIDVGTKILTLISDGLTYLNLASNTIYTSSSTLGVVTYQNFYIDNGTLQSSRNTGISLTSVMSYINCILKGVLLDLYGSGAEMNTCLVLSSTVWIGQTQTGAIPKATRSTFIATTFTTGSTSNLAAASNVVFSGCFFDKTSYMNLSGRTITFINCAFESNGTDFIINVNGTNKNIKAVQLVSDVANIGTTYADAQHFSGSLTNGAGTITFTNCFWTATPGFNDSANSDYTLKISPIANLFNNANIIGAYGLYKRFDCNDEAFNPARTGVSYSGVTRNTGAGTFDLTTPGTPGTVTSSSDPDYAITLPNATTLSSFVNWVGNFNFYNGDWVDKANYSAGVNDEVRMTYRVKVYDDNTSTWSSWYEIEMFQPVRIDGSSKGNGDIAATMTSLTAITGKRFQIEFTLRDDGV